MSPPSPPLHQRSSSLLQSSPLYHPDPNPCKKYSHSQLQTQPLSYAAVVKQQGIPKRRSVHWAKQLATVHLIPPVMDPANLSHSSRLSRDQMKVKQLTNSKTKHLSSRKFSKNEKFNSIQSRKQPTLYSQPLQKSPHDQSGNKQDDGWTVVTYKNARKQKTYPAKRYSLFLPSSKLCFRCLRKGHMAGDCSNLPACYHCKKIGHYAYACKERLNTYKKRPEAFNPSPQPRQINLGRLPLPLAPPLSHRHAMYPSQLFRRSGSSQTSNRSSSMLQQSLKNEALMKPILKKQEPTSSRPSAQPVSNPMQSHTQHRSESIQKKLQLEEIHKSFVFNTSYLPAQPPASYSVHMELDQEIISAYHALQLKGVLTIMNGNPSLSEISHGLQLLWPGWKKWIWKLVPLEHNIYLLELPSQGCLNCAINQSPFYLPTFEVVFERWSPCLGAITKTLPNSTWIRFLGLPPLFQRTSCIKRIIRGFGNYRRLGSESTREIPVVNIYSGHPNIIPTEIDLMLQGAVYHITIQIIKSTARTSATNKNSETTVNGHDTHYSRRDRKDKALAHNHNEDCGNDTESQRGVTRRITEFEKGESPMHNSGETERKTTNDPQHIGSLIDTSVIKLFAEGARSNTNAAVQELQVHEGSVPFNIADDKYVNSLNVDHVGLHSIRDGIYEDPNGVCHQQEQQNWTESSNYSTYSAIRPRSMPFDDELLVIKQQEDNKLSAQNEWADNFFSPTHSTIGPHSNHPIPTGSQHQPNEKEMIDDNLSVVEDSSSFESSDTRKYEHKEPPAGYVDMDHISGLVEARQQKQSLTTHSLQTSSSQIVTPDSDRAFRKNKASVMTLSLRRSQRLHLSPLNVNDRAKELTKIKNLEVTPKKFKVNHPDSHKGSITVRRSLGELNKDEHIQMGKDFGFLIDSEAIQAVIQMEEERAKESTS